MQAATRHSCTCPQATHTTNKKHGLRSIWHTPEWKKESAAYRARHFPVCSRCGRVGPILPGHSGEDYGPAEMAHYIDKVRKDQVVPLCRTCNMMEAKGKHPCPDCITRHREDPDHHIRYIAQGEERCWACEHGADGIVPPRSRKASRKRRTPVHPCRSHLMSGRCQKSRVYAQCEYSARGALRDCEKARPRGAIPA